LFLLAITLKNAKPILIMGQANIKRKTKTKAKTWFKENSKSIALLAFIAAAFISASCLAQHNLDFFKKYIAIGPLPLQILVYVAILTVCAVLAPVDVAFLMPIVAALWGWPYAALISLIGWTLGSCIVFFLTRKYGLGLVKKLVGKDISNYSKIMPKKNLFFGTVFLRIAIPADVVSYAIGLFTDVGFVPYLFATFLGYMPLAFFLAYAGTLPVYVQMIGFAVFFVIIAIAFAQKR
jgi:uncharacterized membrane protein YdjX (TVP38/TMEM64 family)